MTRIGNRAALTLAAIYFVALAASYYQRATMKSAPVVLVGDRREVHVEAVRGERRVGGDVRVVVRDVEANGSTGEDARASIDASGAQDGIPVVLVHGSPGDAEVFDLLVERLRGPRRLIVPDLPGFGQSSHDIPDYSFLADAMYVWEALDQLGIQRVHLVGFSMGGGVVLNMAQLAPERVASVTMLSAINVQEMELLGDYHLNHGIHGAQLAGFWVLKTFVPRFGSWNRSDMGIPYARNFYDSDQRPLAGILDTYAGPMLILHGRKDPLVPFRAALEAERRVPQSELVAFDSNHFMVFRDPRPLVAPLADFLDRVEAGTARTRATALPDRVAASTMPMDRQHWPEPGFITKAVLFLTLALGTFVSEDLACVSAGMLVAEGRAGFLLVACACFVGIVVGDILLFLAGRWIGRAALERAPLRWMIKPQAIDQASAWLHSNGATVVALSRFTPGTRLPTYVAAGILHVPFRKFLGYFLLAAAVWTPLVVALATGLGMPFMHSEWLGRQPLSLKLLVGAVALFVITRLVSALLTFRGRRGLARRWKRLTRWEFWPPYVFYPPVLAYVFWLGLKHRGFTLFTASNPAIPAGGFIGESKGEILSKLRGAEEWLPAHELIAEGEASARVARARELMRDGRFRFPVVLKPDAGQRGSGVAVIRSEEQLQAYLERTTYPVILQEYVAGKEFGIFYYRYPEGAAGRVFSITEKRLPVLVGDGRHTLEELVLRDDRAVCMSDFYLRKNAERADAVPVEGEPVQLVELGTHCRGAIFLDGGEHVTPALQRVMERMARTFDGFYFGRFDVRVPSAEDLREGRNLKIIEVNGVTSEATHIYDPKLTIWQAYRILFEQWRVAFEIGAQNRARGTRATSVFGLLSSMRQYRKQSQEHPE
jgi:membrane protein DedA with SNARE-associated domain/pimeloyl-ACP methyl ester carboxylesterase